MINPQRSRVLDLIKICETENNKAQRSLNQLHVDMESQEKINDYFDSMIETVKNLEGVDFKVVETMYNYKKLDKLEMIEESKNICREYKSGVMDPSRLVAKMERSTKISKRMSGSRV